MFRKTTLLALSLIFLFGIGRPTMLPDTQVDTHKQNLPFLNTQVPPIFLPMVFTPWLNSTFGIEVLSMNNSAGTMAQQAGSAWVRLNALSWAYYQPNNEAEFRVDAGLEQEILTANQFGQKVILIIQKTPLWAREYPDSVCGPIRMDKLGALAHFMGMVVEKYSQPPYNVIYFELWNEPEVQVFRDNPTTPNDESNVPYGCWGNTRADAQFFGGGYYADMLKVVVPAMKAVNPNVKIVLGGLLLDCDPNDPAHCGPLPSAMAGYFEGILNRGGGEYLDVVNFHAYNYFHPEIGPIQREYEIPNWSTSGGQVEGKLAFLLGVMSKYNLNKPIILSEAGLICSGCTSIPAGYEQDKAEYVLWLYTRNLSKGLLATTWYTLDKGGWRGTGLLDINNNPTPAYYAFKTMTNALYAASFVREVGLSTGVRVFEFQKGLKVWVLFSQDGEQKTVNLSNTVASNPREIFDLYGNTCGGQNCSVTGNLVSFDQPIYIIINN